MCGKYNLMCILFILKQLIIRHGKQVEINTTSAKYVALKAKKSNLMMKMIVDCKNDKVISNILKIMYVYVYAYIYVCCKFQFLFL